MSRDNIILIGMPASGKSTVGVILAKLLGRDFIDTDLLIQRREARLLSEIIRDEGLDGFLSIEADVLSGIEASQSVIATGGSAVYGHNAMLHLKELGSVVYLEVDYAAIASRLDDIRSRGVVLREGQTLETLYRERVALYRKYADIIVPESGMGIEATVQAVRNALL